MLNNTKNMKTIKYLLFFIAFIFFFSSCIKSSIIGDDILNKDEIGVEFVDTSSLSAKTLYNDSVRVFPTLTTSFILGKLEDDIIGSATSSLYMDFNTLGNTPDTNVVQFDSIVLSLVVDTSLFYGDSYEKYHLEVFELNEGLRKTTKDTFYSNQSFDYGSKLGEANFVPLAIDSMDIIEPGNDTARIGGQLRIKLDDDLGQRIISDYSAIKDDTLFKDLFKGIYIKTGVEKSSMMGISYTDANSKFVTKIEVYYSVDTVLHKLSFPAGRFVSHFNHDYTNSEISMAVNDQISGDSLMYLQGMEGTKLRVDIKNFEWLKDKNLNKAALTLYTVEESTNKDLPSGIIAFTQDSLGSYNWVDDYRYSVNIQDPDFYFGKGVETEENGITTTKYTINLTLFIRNLIDEGQYNSSLILIPDKRINNPGFAKFFGTKNTVLRSKLNVVYSDKN